VTGTLLASGVLIGRSPARRSGAVVRFLRGYEDRIEAEIVFVATGPHANLFARREPAEVGIEVGFGVDDAPLTWETLSSVVEASGGFIWRAAIRYAVRPVPPERLVVSCAWAAADLQPSTVVIELAP
jgi:hypothetical protein